MYACASCSPRPGLHELSIFTGLDTSGGGQVVQLGGSTMHSMALTADGIVPASVELVPGEKVTFVLAADVRTSFHLVDVVDLAMMRADAAVGVAMDHGRDTVGTVVPAGTTVRLTWTVPDDRDAVRRLLIHDEARDTVAELAPVPSEPVTSPEERDR